MTIEQAPGFLQIMPIKVALILSIFLQFAAAIIAISLIRSTRNNIAWWLISICFLLMAIRRVLELLQVIDADSRLIGGLLSSWTGVGISIILLFSLIFIKRIFNIQKRIDDLRKENESRVLSAIIKTEESERQHFAKELHDSLGPLLSSVKLALSALAKEAGSTGNREVLDNTENLIDESISTLKEISNNLSPHILNNFGLLKAVKSFIDKLQIQDRPKIIVSSNIENKRFAKNIEVVLYRVICELITNTLKHASAGQINIDLFVEPELLTLEYYDDGIGFDLERMEEENRGMGYSNIISRIKSINGNFQVITEPDEGMNVHIAVKTA